MQVNDSPRQVDSLEIDTTVAHAGRIYDYLRGGVDNFEAPRWAASPDVLNPTIAGATLPPTQGDDHEHE